MRKETGAETDGKDADGGERRSPSHRTLLLAFFIRNNMG